MTESKTNSQVQEKSSPKSLKPLVVSVLPKIVKLPENEVTLSAYTVPSEQQGWYRWCFFLGIFC